MEDKDKIQNLVVRRIVGQDELYAMTTIGLNFSDQDPAQIDDEAFFTLSEVFSMFLFYESSYKDQIHWFCKGVGQSGFFITASHLLTKEDCFDLVEEMCEFVLYAEVVEPADTDYLKRLKAGLESAKSYVKEYLECIESEGGYLYEEVEAE